MDLFAPKPAPNVDHVTRVKAWVADAMPLLPGSTVMVTELTCREPGCPPLETVIAVLGGKIPRKETLHKALAQVTAEDVRAITARWMDADLHD